MEESLSTGEIALVINTAWTNNIDEIITEIKHLEKQKGKEREFAKGWFEKKVERKLIRQTLTLFGHMQIQIFLISLVQD